MAPSQAPFLCSLDFLLIEHLLRSSCGLRGPVGRSRLPSGHGCVWDSCPLHIGQGKGHSYFCLHGACQEVEASEDSGTRNLVAAGPGEDRYRNTQPGWQWVWEAASTGGAEGGGGWWTRLAFLHWDTQLYRRFGSLKSPHLHPPWQQVVLVQRHPSFSLSLLPPPLGHCKCHKNRSLAAHSMWEERDPAVSHSPASRARVCFIIAAWLYFTMV